MFQKQSAGIAYIIVRYKPSDIEAVILTGGESRRMGSDKSELLVEGVSTSNRIVNELASRSIPITILGRKPIDGCRFLPDEVHFQGPLHALSRHTAILPYCFVSSCDMPGFDGNAVAFFHSQIKGYQAVIPKVGDKLQPLCALYGASAWPPLRQLASGGERRIMKWIDELIVRIVDANDMQEAGIRPEACTNINTKEELNEFLHRRTAGRRDP